MVSWMSDMLVQHTPDKYPTHCRTCNVRTPCGTRMVIDEAVSMEADLAQAKAELTVAREALDWEKK